jgi:hypothetical protein
MAKLTFVRWPPCIDFSKRWLCDGMFETTFYCVNSFSNVSEALNKLWKLSWVYVPKTKLSVWIIFSEWVNEALVWKKESEIMTTRHFTDFGFITEWHSNRDALLDTILNEWPSICLTLFWASEVEISTSSYIANFYIWFWQCLQFLRLEDIFIMTKTKLTSEIPSPNNDFIRFLNK